MHRLHVNVCTGFLFIVRYIYIYIYIYIYQSQTNRHVQKVAIVMEHAELQDTYTVLRIESLTSFKMGSGRAVCFVFEWSSAYQYKTPTDDLNKGFTLFFNSYLIFQ